MRKRVLTENIGCFLSKGDSEMVKAHAKALRLSVSDYLRQVAVHPLKVQAEVQDEQAD